MLSGCLRQPPKRRLEPEQSRNAILRSAYRLVGCRLREGPRPITRPGTANGQRGSCRPRPRRRPLKPDGRRQSRGEDPGDTHGRRLSPTAAEETARAKTISQGEPSRRSPVGPRPSATAARRERRSDRSRQELGDRLRDVVDRDRPPRAGGAELQRARAVIGDVGSKSLPVAARAGPGPAPRWRDARQTSRFLSIETESSRGVPSCQKHASGTMTGS